MEEFVRKAIDGMTNGEIREYNLDKIPFTITATTNDELSIIADKFNYKTHSGLVKPVRIWVQFGVTRDRWGAVIGIDKSKPLFMAIMKNVTRKNRKAYLGYIKL